MKKPVFADIAELVGGLIEAEKKKKKRRTAPSKYDVINVPALVRALPARPPRPARLPVVLVPGAPRDAPAPAPALKGRHRRTHLEVVRDESISKLWAVNAVQTKRRQAAAELLEAESAFYDPNKKRLTAAKIKKIDNAYKSAQENDDKRARDLGAALAASDAAKEVYAHEQARMGIRAETPAPEPEEVFADSTPAKKVKTPKKSLDAAFAEASRTKATKAEAKAADKAAKAAARDELKAARIDAAAAAKDVRVEAAAAKAAPEPPKALVNFQKRIKAQTAAREEVRRKNYALAGLAAPGGDPPDLVGVGRFLGRFCHSD
jgi:hypothetical protein